MNNILKALQFRYAVKIFDPEKKVSDNDIRTILESGRLAPSSLGLEPWQFIVVKSPEIRQKLREVSYDQPKVTDASHLILITRRTDIRESLASELLTRAAEQQSVDISALEGLKGMVEGSIQGKTDEQLAAWMQAQTYIALGMMVETAALLNVDSCPMEGFDGRKVDEILDLQKLNLTTVSMLAIGYRGNDEAAMRPKVRRLFSEVVTLIE